MKIRDVFRLCIGLLPASAFKNMLLRRSGYAVASTARIGPCLILRVAALQIGERARIGPFNVIRDLETISLSDDSVIGQFNWISASPILVESGGRGAFIMGKHAAFTSRHYVDASDLVEIGEYTTVAGVRSTFVTHGIDWRENIQTLKPIRIGAYCLIGSNASVVPGTTLAPASVTGMGTTLGGDNSPNALILGSRGTVVRESLSGRFFVRSTGFTHPRLTTHPSEG